MSLLVFLSFSFLERTPFLRVCTSSSAWWRRRRSSSTRPHLFFTRLHRQTSTRRHLAQTSRLPHLSFFSSSRRRSIERNRGKRPCWLVIEKTSQRELCGGRDSLSVSDGPVESSVVSPCFSFLRSRDRETEQGRQMSVYLCLSMVMSATCVLRDTCT